MIDETIYDSPKWLELIKEFEESLDNIIDLLKGRNEFRNISPLRPSSLLNSELQLWQTRIPVLLANNGNGFRRIISQLANIYFPLRTSFTETVKAILNNLFQGEHQLINIQKKTVREFIFFLISPESKHIVSQDEESFLNKIIEAFRSSKYLIVPESTIRNLSSSSSLINLDDKTKNIFRFLQVEEMTKKEIDSSTGKSIKRKYYKFSDNILRVLEELGILFKSSSNNLYQIKNEKLFDINLFSAIILAQISFNERNSLNLNLKIGILSQIALLFMLAIQKSVSREFMEYGNNKEKLEKHGFNSENLDIIPKSWLYDEIITMYAFPLIKCIAFIIGGQSWLNLIELEKKSKINKLVKQLATRIPSINQWKMGEKIRVNIPILVDVGNIMTEIMPQAER